MGEPQAAAIVQQLTQNTILASAASEQNEMSDTMQAILASLPLRGLVAFSNGAMTEEMLDGIIDQLNQA